MHVNLWFISSPFTNPVFTSLWSATCPINIEIQNFFIISLHLCKDDFSGDIHITRSRESMNCHLFCICSNYQSSQLKTLINVHNTSCFFGLTSIFWSPSLREISIIWSFQSFHLHWAEQTKSRYTWKSFSCRRVPPPQKCDPIFLCPSPCFVEKCAGMEIMLADDASTGILCFKYVLFKLFCGLFFVFLVFCF